MPAPLVSAGERVIFIAFTAPRARDFTSAGRKPYNIRARQQRDGERGKKNPINLIAMRHGEQFAFILMVPI